jgi:hypothetical protein
MKIILSGLLALAFMLPTAPSHAFNPQGAITVTQITGQHGVTGFSLVGQCKPNSAKAKSCKANSLKAHGQLIRDIYGYEDGMATIMRIPSKWKPVIRKAINDELKKCMKRC